MIPVAAAPVTVVTGAAVPFLVISNEVQLAIVAGFFNVVLNGWMLFLQYRSKNDIEETKKVAHQAKDTADKNHDIVERRLTPRKDKSAS